MRFYMHSQYEILGDFVCACVCGCAHICAMFELELVFIPYFPFTLFGCVAHFGWALDTIYLSLFECCLLL